MLPQATGYSWNATAHRYIDNSTGRFVSNADIRNGLENVIDVAGIEMNSLTQSLIDGRISLADWQSGMMQNIKATHTASAALANGGWGQMTQSDWGATGQLIREQYDYLRNLSREIANGTQALDGRLLVRSDMYADASNGTYWEIDKRSMLADGYDEGRRVLEPGADHCDDCLEYASEGWMPIDDIPQIGDSQCLTRCRCEIEFRKSSEALQNEPLINEQVIQENPIIESNATSEEKALNIANELGWNGETIFAGEGEFRDEGTLLAQMDNQGVMRIYNAALNKDEETLRGIIAHEIQHNIYLNLPMEERGALLRENMRDILGGAEVNMLNFYQSAGGFTPYSSHWWDIVRKDISKFDVAVDETLAEAARLNSIGKSSDVHPFWQKLYERMK